MSNGRLEAAMIPEAQWSVSGHDDSGAWGPVSIATAGSTVWPSELAATLETQINGVATDTFTVTGSLGEGGTGLVTISSTASSWSVSFTGNVGLAIGHDVNTGTVSGSLAGDRQQAGIWLPDCPIYSTRRAGDAPYVTDLVTTTSPLGHTKTLYGNRYRKLDGIYWGYISEAKTTIVAESTPRASFEQFWTDTILGEGYDFFAVGSPWRLYWDADVATYFECKPQQMATFDPTLSVDGWRAYFRVELPTLVEVP